MSQSSKAEQHPMIVFREGASGLRRPALVGTRLYVWQVAQTVRDSDNSVAGGADYLGLPEHHVRDAVEYYADFEDEFDRYRSKQDEFGRRERARWERTQRVLD